MRERINEGMSGEREGGGKDGKSQMFLKNDSTKKKMES